MITAKDLFVIEQEMIAETLRLMQGSNLSSEEQEVILYGMDGISEGEYDELNKNLIDRQITCLDRLKNGEYLNASQVNAAVIRAAKND